MGDCKNHLTTIFPEVRGITLLSCLNYCYSGLSDVTLRLAHHGRLGEPPHHNLP
jgi:hypothetical protein